MSVRGDFSKKHGISCGARRCTHNIAGACSAGIISVAEAILQKNCGPHCETFTLRDHSANTLRGFFSPESASRERGDITCALVRCIHNSHNLCTAETVSLSAPQPAESTFIPCRSYVKK